MVLIHRKMLEIFYILLEVCISRVGSGFFNPTYHSRVEKKKHSIQPTNPTHMDWVGPIGWTLKKRELES